MAKEKNDKGKGLLNSHRVEAHPGHGQPALDGRVHDDAALAPPQVGERGLGRVNISPEVDVLLMRVGEVRVDQDH